ncbi:MAG: RadC family protein [Deltaproteobacteria bacterium]
MTCYDTLEQLSNRDLLAITLRENPQSPTVDSLSAMAQYPEELITCTVEELMLMKGIGRKKALQLKASVELGRRIYQAPPKDMTIIKGPADMANLLLSQMRYLDREQFQEVLLNRKNGVISIETVSIGGLSSSLAHPREIFKPAIRKSAASIILAHNHPSGDPTPSQEDLELTRRIAEAGSLLGIDVLDHIIIGDACWISLKSTGHI